jgi:hypothetical protein
MSKQMSDACGLTEFLSGLTEKERTSRLMLSEILRRMEDSMKARFGHSKEKRSDANMFDFFIILAILRVGWG